MHLSMWFVKNEWKVKLNRGIEDKNKKYKDFHANEKSSWDAYESKEIFLMKQ